MNLVSMGMNFFGPAVARKIAGMIGIDSPMVVNAITAALPAILAAVAGKSAKGDGAGSILGLLSSAKDASPADFESGLEGASIADLSANGGELLSQLIGGNEASSIANAVGRHANIPADGVQSLLGTMGPAVAGLLKTQVADGNLDAAGFADMLKGQSANIAQGMPDGFAQQLAGSGIMEAIGGGAQDTVAQVRETVAASKETVTETVEAASSGGGGMMKWLVIAAVIAAGAWFFLGKGTPEVPDIADVAGDTLMVGDVNVSEQFGGITESLTGALTGITDAASAEAAVPQLEEASQGIDGIGDLIGQLGGDQQGMFGGLVSTALTALRPLIDQALAAAGEGSPIQPIVEGLLEKLTAMAG